MKPGRRHDNEELRFSLRSLEQHAPWVRNVYVVTDNQVPHWLETTNPRLKLVSVDDLFPNAADLPTFNSNAIEWQLRRIPELSQRFLYFNDDMFLGASISPSDLFTPAGGQRIYLDRDDIWRQVDPKAVTIQGWSFTQAMLDDMFGPAVRKQPAHVPRLYDKCIVEQLERMWPGEITGTAAHRFRAPDDVAVAILYGYYLLESTPQSNLHQAVAAAYGWEYAFVMLSPHWRALRPQVINVANCRPKFFCFNDDLGSPLRAKSWLIRRYIRLFLRNYFPKPSSFER